MSVEAVLARWRPAVEAALERFTPPADAAPAAIHEAMRYSLFAGGKRLRPVLVALAFETAGGEGDAWAPVAAAVEMIHTYSLIHDDLPAMDDDDLRRGQPTAHKVFGEALAILSGDALLTRAFEILATEIADPARAVRVIAELGGAAGTLGMVGGQVLDLAAEGVLRSPDAKESASGTESIGLSREIPRMKTAALIRGSLRAGALVAGGDAQLLEKIGVYGEKVGIAFQVIDDMLDLSSTAEELGKTPGKDVRQGKLTVPEALGLDGARGWAESLIREATDAIEREPGADALIELAHYVLARKS